MFLDVKQFDRNHDYSVSTMQECDELYATYIEKPGAITIFVVAPLMHCLALQGWWQEMSQLIRKYPLLLSDGYTTRLKKKKADFFAPILIAKPALSVSKSNIQDMDISLQLLSCVLLSNDKCNVAMLCDLIVKNGVLDDDNLFFVEKYSANNLLIYYKALQVIEKRDEKHVE